MRTFWVCHYQDIIMKLATYTGSLLITKDYTETMFVIRYIKNMIVQSSATPFKCVVLILNHYDFLNFVHQIQFLIRLAFSKLVKMFRNRARCRSLKRRQSKDSNLREWPCKDVTIICPFCVVFKWRGHHNFPDKIRRSQRCKYGQQPSLCSVQQLRYA